MGDTDQLRGRIDESTQFLGFGKIDKQGLTKQNLNNNSSIPLYVVNCTFEAIKQMFLSYVAFHVAISFASKKNRLNHVSV